MGAPHCADFIDRPEQVLGTNLQDVGVVPDNACDGQMTFLKRSTLDTIYIGVRGKSADSKNYNIILTDDVPSFTLDAIVPGSIRAKGTSATSTLSTWVSGSLRGGK